MIWFFCLPPKPISPMFPITHSDSSPSLEFIFFPKLWLASLDLELLHLFFLPGKSFLLPLAWLTGYCHWDLSWSDMSTSIHLLISESLSHYLLPSFSCHHQFFFIYIFISMTLPPHPDQILQEPVTEWACSSQNLQVYNYCRHIMGSHKGMAKRMKERCRAAPLQWPSLGN